MNIQYDPESDSLVIYLREGAEVEQTEPLDQDERILIDLDANDRLARGLRDHGGEQRTGRGRQG